MLERERDPLDAAVASSVLKPANSSTSRASFRLFSLSSTIRISWLTTPPARLGRVKRNVLPWPGSLSTQRRPPCSSTSLRESGSPSPVPSACLPSLRLLELLEDRLQVLGRRCRGRCRRRRSRPGRRRARAETSTRPSAGRELDRVGEEVEDDLAHASLVGRDRDLLRLGVEGEREPAAARALACIETALRRMSGIATCESSSSMRPASILARSRTSLISESRCLPASSTSLDVGELALVQLAEHLLVQHLAEADDRVQRRAQLVRHRGEEVGLVRGSPSRARAYSALELVAHPVHVRGEAADLVAVRDLEVACEVARGDLGEPLLGAAQRHDDRPREEEPERKREREASRGDADQEIARARERAPVGGDERVCAGAGLARIGGRPATRKRLRICRCAEGSIGRR